MVKIKAAAPGEVPPPLSDNPLPTSVHPEHVKQNKTMDMAAFRRFIRRTKMLHHCKLKWEGEALSITPEAKGEIESFTLHYSPEKVKVTTHWSPRVLDKKKLEKLYPKEFVPTGAASDAFFKTLRKAIHESTQNVEFLKRRASEKKIKDLTKKLMDNPVDQKNKEELDRAVELYRKTFASVRAALQDCMLVQQMFSCLATIEKQK